MQGTHPSNGSQSSNMFASVLASSHSLFTPKRVGFTLAGAFVLAGSAAAMSGGANPQHAKPAPQTLTVQTSADNTAGSENSSSATTDAATTVDGSTAQNTDTTNVQLHVNGQNIDVPANGSVQQSVPTQDGSGTSSVSINASNNNSSSSLNVNISSNSSSSGNSFSSSSTMVSEDGGSTFISNN
jgi:hypothetical protein